MNTSRERLWHLKQKFILVHTCSLLSTQARISTLCTPASAEVDAVSQIWGTVLLVTDFNLPLQSWQPRYWKASFCAKVPIRQAHCRQTLASSVWSSCLVLHALTGKAPGLDLPLGKWINKKNEVSAGEKGGQQVCPQPFTWDRLKLSTCWPKDPSLTPGLRPHQKAAPRQAEPVLRGHLHMVPGTNC